MKKKAHGKSKVTIPWICTLLAFKICILLENKKVEFGEKKVGFCLKRDKKKMLGNQCLHRGAPKFLWPKLRQQRQPDCPKISVAKFITYLAIGVQ